MGSQMEFWCDICGQEVADGSALNEFAYRYGQKQGKAEVCEACGSSLEEYLRTQVKYKNGPAE